MRGIQKLCKKYSVLSAALLLVSLTACGQADDVTPGILIATPAPVVTTLEGMEKIPLIDYVVPKEYPKVLADQAGYQADAAKKAGVRGRVLPEEFRLVDAATGEVVYRGRVSDRESVPELDLAVGYADFTEWQRPGSYYILCDRIGESERFFIQDAFYKEQFEALQERILGRCRLGEASPEEVLELLVVCDWYPELCPDRDADRIPDVLKEIAVWISQTTVGAQESRQSLYAALLAKFSYLYQSYDLELAKDCLKLASSAYEQTKDRTKGAENFLALTELYRATGMSGYHSQILEYESFFTDNTAYGDDRQYLYGVMTYLVTRQRVDLELCGLLMEQMRERAEEAAGLLKDMTNPVTPHNNGSEDLLRRSVQVADANYVLRSYEYTHVLEEYLHFLCGANPEAVNFYESEPGQGSRYLLLFAQLAAAYGG